MPSGSWQPPYLIICCFYDLVLKVHRFFKLRMLNTLIKARQSLLNTKPNAKLRYIFPKLKAAKLWINL